MTTNDYSLGNDKNDILTAFWSFVFINAVLQYLSQPAAANPLKHMVVGLLADDFGGNLNLLFATSVLELQMVMLILCRYLPPRVSTSAHVSLVALSLILILTVPQNHLADYLFSYAQVAGLLAILWVVWIEKLVRGLFYLLIPPLR